jgi:hypothetical protein
MEFMIVEALSLIIVVGALVLLGMRVITYEQAVTLISIALSMITGKYIAKYERTIVAKAKSLRKRGITKPTLIILSLIGLILGIFLWWGGEWLIWDWINSIVNGPWLDRVMFCSEWVFYAPLFLYKWTCENWTAVFDLSKLWLDAGLLLTIVSAFSLGLYMRPVVEAFIKKIKQQKK